MSKRQGIKRLSRYGLSEEQYDQMLRLQGERCMICLQPFTTVPHVDHNHDTGQVRGLLW